MNLPGVFFLFPTYEVMIMLQKDSPAVYDTAVMKKEATRVSLVNIAGNTALSVFKLLAGILAHSGAMISDAVHSASDVLSSFIVIIGVKLAAREPDRDHPYGHERVVLAFTGALIGYGAVAAIINREDGAAVPGVLALVAAAVSIVSKEIMFWYTRAYAKRLGSAALMASAWDHRSDALSSVGALIGIAGARMGLAITEPIASLVICVFILKAAYDCFRDAAQKMVDRACDAETERAIESCVLAQSHVLGIDRLQTREFGSRIYVDLEIRLDGNLTLYESHAIAEQVHDRIEQEFPSVKHIMIHVNPGDEAK